MLFEALMAKKGITIKRLAKALGVTSRVLIDRCRAEGLSVQNSVTKLESANEQRVRAWFSSTQAKN
jgi:plasmid maintenance system antidote protein VapI